MYFVLRTLKKVAAYTIFSLTLVRCADEEFLTNTEAMTTSATITTTTTGMTVLTDCLSCAYVVPADNNIIDGARLGLKPGDVIGLSSNIKYGNLIFRNIVGTAENPIVIRNCGGVARIDATGRPDGLKTENSRYFRITGGNTDQVYGIKIIGGHMSLNLTKLSTNFEVDHIEITNSGFAGIMAKTDPSCDEATWRGNFVMKDVALHHNAISATGGEGIYAGNSFFTGMSTPCGTKLPHEIHNISIYSNVIKNTGWDAIQLGCATKGASIHGNIIENFGTKNEAAQNNGIQIGSGTGGSCYNNLIRKGTGNGMIVLGLGDNIIYNNIIDQAGGHGIFCDERYTPGAGFKFVNNTIINPKGDGIRIYAELVPMNAIINNIISNPGSYSTYVYPRTPSDAFVYKLSKDVKIEMANNFFTTTTDSLRVVDLAALNYRLELTSPVIDKGRDPSAYCQVTTDFYNKPRRRGAGVDIGAVENATLSAPNSIPVANAGPDIILTLPINSATLVGTARDADGSIVSYRWSQYGGPAVTIGNPNSATAILSGLTEGQYYFKLTVTDDEGATDGDNVLVNVIAPPNVPPIANAGSDESLALPLNTIRFRGSATDTDGTIVSYQWTQYGGPSADIAGANTPTPFVTVHESGNYYFRLTVKDNRGDTHYDNMLLRVTGVMPVNKLPTANAGRDYTLTLPTNSVKLLGSGYDSDGKITSYKWTQYGGERTYIAGENTPTASLTGLKAGQYYFRLTVTDDDGATAYDNVLVRVVENL